MSQTETLARHEGNGKAEKVPQPGRDLQGRFCKGNPGGPGNPFARQVAELRQAFVDRADPARVAALVDKLWDMALAGDTAAAKLVLAYTLGRPAAAVNPDELDAQEVELFRRENVPDLEEQVRAVSAGFACVVLRNAVPALAEKMGQDLAAQNKALDELQRLKKERQEKEAARRQARKEKEAARRAQRKARLEARGEEAAPRPRPKPRPQPELPTVEQILAWARQGPEAALAEARAVNKPGETEGGSPHPSQ